MLCGKFAVTPNGQRASMYGFNGYGGHDGHDGHDVACFYGLSMESLKGLREPPNTNGSERMDNLFGRFSGGGGQNLFVLLQSHSTEMNRIILGLRLQLYRHISPSQPLPAIRSGKTAAKLFELHRHS